MSYILCYILVLDDGYIPRLKKKAKQKKKKYVRQYTCQGV